MSKDQGLKLYTDSDMVDAVFAGEEVKIPKKWVGTEYADGYVLADKAAKGSEPVVVPEGAPTDEWTVPQLDKYAADNAVDGYSAAKKKDEKLPLIVAHFTAAQQS